VAEVSGMVMSCDRVVQVLLVITLAVLLRDVASLVLRERREVPTRIRAWPLTSLSECNLHRPTHHITPRWTV
jgi:hypothetical protein